MAFTVKKMRWNEQVLDLIDKTLRPAKDFDAADYVRKGVSSGKMELWNLDGKSHAITETCGDDMRVHSYQGEDVKGFAKIFSQLARRSGCKTASFHSDDPALPKLLKLYQPKQVGTNEYKVNL